MDKTNVDEFIKILRSIVRDESEKYIKSRGVEGSYAATVSYIGDEVESSEQTVSVKMSGNGADINGLRNLTGELLAVGDVVRIYTHTDRYSDGYIGIKIGGISNESV